MDLFFGSYYTEIRYIYEKNLTNYIINKKLYTTTLNNLLSYHNYLYFIPMHSQNILKIGMQFSQIEIIRVQSCRMPKAAIFKS